MGFLAGLDIAEDGITVVTDRKGRNSGEAFVQFSSQQAADEALQRDREVIGERCGAGGSARPHRGTPGLLQAS